MLIQVNFGDVKHSEALDAFVREKVSGHLGHLAEKVTRVEVHLRDDNSPTKSASDDKRCTMEARLAKRKPFAIKHRGDDLYKVINDAAAKLSRAVGSDIGRVKTRSIPGVAV